MPSDYGLKRKTVHGEISTGGGLDKSAASVRDG
jgi:hypothetical protein